MKLQLLESSKQSQKKHNHATQHTNPSPSVEPSTGEEAKRIAAIEKALKDRGIHVERIDQKVHPTQFAAAFQAIVANQRDAAGDEHFQPEQFLLPIAVVNDVLVLQGRYPTNEEVMQYFHLTPHFLKPQPSTWEMGVRIRKKKCC